MFNKGDHVVITDTKRQVTYGNTTETFGRTDVELLKEEHMTLQEKIKKLTEGTAVLHTPTQEVYDKLMVELEKRGYKWELSHMEWSCVLPYLRLESNVLHYGDEGYYESMHMPILELTSADFPEVTQVTIIGDTTVQMKAKVTKDDNGYTIEKLVEPKFAVGEIVVTLSGQVVKILGIHDGNYKFQWCDGSINEQPLEVFELNFKRLPW